MAAARGAAASPLEASMVSIAPPHSASSDLPVLSLGGSSTALAPGHFSAASPLASRRSSSAARHSLEVGDPGPDGGPYPDEISVEDFLRQTELANFKLCHQPARERVSLASCLILAIMGAAACLVPVVLGGQIVWYGGVVLPCIVCIWLFSEWYPIQVRVTGSHLGVRFKWMDLPPELSVWQLTPVKLVSSIDHVVQKDLPPARSPCCTSRVDFRLSTNGCLPTGDACVIEFAPRRKRASKGRGNTTPVASPPSQPSEDGQNVQGGGQPGQSCWAAVLRLCCCAGSVTATPNTMLLTPAGNMHVFTHRLRNAVFMWKKGGARVEHHLKTLASFRNLGLSSKSSRLLKGETVQVENSLQAAGPALQRKQAGTSTRALESA